MKKILLSALLLAASATLYTGCKKDDNDTTAPIVTIIGDNPMYVVAVDSNFVNMDPGATASDDKDGDLTSKIVPDYSAYIKNVAGEYEIHYEVTDKAGNLGDDHRVLYVTHTGAQLAGLTFTTRDSAFLAGNPTPSIVTYNTTTSLSSEKYRSLMLNFSDGVFTTYTVYMDMEANRITIPSQTPNGPGSAITISGSGTMSKNLVTGKYTIVLTYTIVETGQPTLTAYATLLSQ